MLLRSFFPGLSLQEHMRSIGFVHFQFTEDTIISERPYAPWPETSLHFFPRVPNARNLYELIPRLI